MTTTVTTPSTTRRWTWRTRSILFLIGAWLAFVLLHRLLSGRVWWWGVPELAPPIVFVLFPVIGLGLAALARPVRWPAAALAVLSLAAGASLGGLNPGVLWHRPPPAPADAIDVFSWNTWYWDTPGNAGTEPPAGGTPAADVDAFYAYLHEQDADVYLLQEYIYFNRDGRPVRVDADARLRQEFPGYRIDVVGELVTLSRLPVVEARPINLEPFLPAGRTLSKPGPADIAGTYYTDKALRTDIDVYGTVVSFYNSHVPTPVEMNAASFTPERMSEAHDSREASFRALAADLAGNPRPAFVAGDLNTSPVMGIQRLIPDRLRDAGPALRSPYPVSWDDRRLGLWRIDWVFTTPDVTVHRYELIPTRGQSDHRGQSLLLSLS
ncbi:endonuclease/exonuclease/phosphatase family protein [Catenuloplanes sp. NPDC051500]|uniref:endonuclease/exonuclease/phosphatase family protein n=1 Tax=Catenuloplanes sp. NPDC051500 TaxID=3363959 RepID=UPI0037A383B7